MNPGETLDGRYVINARLGAGGMGEVYRATHAFLGSPRVIKVVHPNIATNTDAQERFLREARVATKVQHQNVATLHDFAALPDGSHYMVWEFIDGENLAQRLRSRGTLPPREAVRIIIQALRGLDAIHRAGIIHRDISPENLMLTPAGDVKIIDLGVAKLEDPDAVSSTRTGIFVGKLRYAAPEQLGFLPEGEKVDGRTDLYAIAMVLFELLTGRPPYEAKSPHEYFLHHAREVRQPDVTLPHAMPGRPALQTVLEKALSRDRTHRFASAADFATALETIERTLPLQADTPTVQIPLDSEPTSILDVQGAATILTPSPGAATEGLASTAAETVRTPLPSAETVRTPLPGMEPSVAPSRSRSLVLAAAAVLLLLVAAGGAFALWPKLSEVLATRGVPAAPVEASLPQVSSPAPASANVDVTPPSEVPAAAIETPAVESPARAPEKPVGVVPPPAADDERKVKPDPSGLQEVEPAAPRRVSVYIDGPGRNLGNERALNALRRELRGVNQIALRAGGAQVDVYRAINRYVPDLEFVGEADVVIQFDATPERLRRQGSHLAASATIEKNGRLIFRYELPSYVDRSAAAEAFAQVFADAFAE